MIFAPPDHIGYFEATIYDDDGESNAYVTGGYCVLKVAVGASAAGACLEVTVTRTGAWTPPYTELALVPARRHAQLRRRRHAPITAA